MNRLTETLAILITGFSLLLVGLLAVLVYVIFRRRRSLSGSDPSRVDFFGRYFSSCWPSKNNQSRVEPARVQSAGNPPGDEEMESCKWGMGTYCLYGPSRVLFTIKEEEKEEGSGADSTISSARVDHNPTAEVARRVSVSLGECFQEGKDDDLEDDNDVCVVRIQNDAVEEVHDDETSPFETPSASPAYYTPTGSPVYDEV